MFRSLLQEYNGRKAELRRHSGIPCPQHFFGPNLEMAPSLLTVICSCQQIGHGLVLSPLLRRLQQRL